MQQTKNKKSPSDKKAKKILEKMNVPKIICVNLIGETHSVYHRMGAGTLIMCFGVCISQASSMVGTIYIIHFLGDMIGYLVHGIGTIPFVETLIAHVSKSSMQGIDDEGFSDDEGIS